MGTAQKLAFRMVGEPESKAKDEMNAGGFKSEAPKKNVKEDAVVKKLGAIRGGLDEIRWSLYGGLGLLKDNGMAGQAMKPQFGKNKEDFKTIKKEFENLDGASIKGPKAAKIVDEIRKLITEIGQLIGELNAISGKEERVYKKIS